MLEYPADEGGMVSIASQLQLHGFALFILGLDDNILVSLRRTHGRNTDIIAVSIMRTRLASTSEYIKPGSPGAVSKSGNDRQPSVATSVVLLTEMISVESRIEDAFNINFVTSLH